MLKKGSLNLSINAIVVLILAITMLGLGLGFMKTMFGQATEQFDDVAGEMKARLIDEIKSSSKRITLNVNDVEMKRGSTKEFFFGIKNDLESEKTFGILKGGTISSSGKWDNAIASAESTVMCYSNFQDNTPDGQINFKTNQVAFVKDNDVGVYKLVISASSAAKLTTYSCAIVVCEPEDNIGKCKAADETTAKLYDRKDFTIEVK